MQDELCPFSAHGVTLDPCPSALPSPSMGFATPERKKQVV